MKYYFKDGKTIWERKFDNVGFTWIQYWDNGSLKFKAQWKDMKCNGEAVLSDHRGQILKQVQDLKGRLF